MSSSEVKDGEARIPTRMVPYLYIASSTFEREPPRPGVFAARQFARGAVIGFVAGRKDTNPGKAGDPVHARLHNTDDVRGLCHVRDHDCRPSVLRYDIRDCPDDDPPMFLGMHYMVDAQKKFNGGVGLEAIGRQLHNCILLSDGSIVALKKIHVGTELYCYTDSDDVPEGVSDWIYEKLSSEGQSTVGATRKRRARSTPKTGVKTGPVAKGARTEASGTSGKGASGGCAASNGERGSGQEDTDTE